MGRYEFVEDGPRYEFEDSSRATIEDEANKRLVAAGSVMGKSQPVSMFGIEFSKDKPATEIGGNPGAAAIAATLAKWGSNIIPGVDSPELQQNRAMLGENFKDRQEYAGAGFLMDMLPNLTMARLMPNAGYLNQVIQGTLGGQMVGGKEGAMIGAAGSALFGAPQLLGNTAKRVTLEEPWWMRGAGSQTKTATSPKYLAGQTDETLLGAPLTVGQKTGNLAIIQKERALLSEAPKEAQELYERQLAALQAKQGQFLDTLGPRQSLQQVGEGARTAAEKHFSYLAKARSDSWRQAFENLPNKDARTFLMKPYADSLRQIIKDNKLLISNAQVDEVLKAAERRLLSVVDPKTGAVMKGTGREVQRLTSEAGESAAAAGKNPFADLGTAAERHVSKVMKEALEEVIDLNAGRGNTVAQGLKKAREMYAADSKAIDMFEATDLGKSIKGAKSPEQIVRAVLDLSNPSDINASMRYIKQYNPDLAKSMVREYGEILVQKGMDPNALGGYNVGKFMEGKPVKSTAKAPDKQVAEELLTPQQQASMEDLYRMAGRVQGPQGLVPPSSSSGRQANVQESQIAGLLGGGVSKQGVSPIFLARYLAGPLLNPIQRGWLTQPAGQGFFNQGGLLNPSYWGGYGATGGILADIYGQEQ